MTFQRVLEVLGAVLRLSSLATPEEKQDIMVGPSVVCTAHYLISGTLALLKYDATRWIRQPEVGTLELESDLFKYSIQKSI